MLPYEDSTCYCLHVRGFTMHASSQVTHRGTFAGVVEKLDYLQEIGVTTVEFQPVYEFDETPEKTVPEDPPENLRPWRGKRTEKVNCPATGC